MIDGFVHPDFTEVATVFRQQLRRTDGGASLAVYHRGEPVVDMWGGRRTADGDPWAHDTVAMSFSTTKGVASTALHLLAERGALDEAAPVAEYWPEFAQAGKAAINVRHVLTHSAGLHRIRPLIDHAERMLDWEHMVGVLAEAPPAYEPGTANGYHALTYGWLAGELVRRVDGRPIERFVADELAAPLGLDGLYIGCPPAERHRVAPLARAGVRLTAGPPMARRLQKQLGARMGRAATIGRLPFDPRRAVSALVPKGVDEVFWSDRVMDAAVPAANGFFTARSLAKLYAMVAGGGTVDGVQLLSPERVERMAVVQSMRRDLVLGIRMRWRLGYHLVGTTRGVVDGAFGHFGYGGSGGWCDPKRQLAVGFTTSRGSGTPIGDARILQLGTAVLGCVRDRKRAAARASARVA
jgi:CubicO group peptidase (beta-lactamase class C family)